MTFLRRDGRHRDRFIIHLRDNYFVHSSRWATAQLNAAISPLDAGTGAASDWKGGVSHLAAGRSSVTRLRAQTGRGSRRKIRLWPSLCISIGVFLDFLSAPATPCFTSLELDKVRCASVCIMHKLQKCIRCRGLSTSGRLRRWQSRGFLQSGRGFAFRIQELWMATEGSQSVDGTINRSFLCKWSLLHVGYCRPCTFSQLLEFPKQFS